MKFITACLTLKVLAISFLMSTKIYTDNEVRVAYWNQKAMQHASLFQPKPITTVINTKKGK